MTTALLQQGRDLLLTAPLGTTTAPDSAAATRRAEERPRSPPQPVPRRHAAAAAHQQPPSASSVEWEDALGVAASPSSSDATEQFLDCYSEREWARKLTALRWPASDPSRIWGAARASVGMAAQGPPPLARRAW